MAGRRPPGEDAGMKIAVSGASGLMGSALVPALRSDGHEVVRLVRRAASARDEVEWDPAAHRLDPADLSGVDAAVNLSGAGVGDRRWTAAYKRTILTSRVDTTTTLADALAKLDPAPRVLLSASGMDFYGDTGARVVDESAPSGDGFLAGVCRAWEAATEPAGSAGIRVVHLRSAPVLSRKGGFLGRIVPLFRLGVGGCLGSGRQYWPWISLRDQVDAMRFLLTADTVDGPVNLTGPAPVTNKEFTAALAAAVHRPAVIPVPGFALRIAVGGFAQEVVLTGKRAVPAVLTAAGFRFTHPDVATALRWATAR
jgi:uncharacterized protein (TIGR01777 family)